MIKEFGNFTDDSSHGGFGRDEGVGPSNVPSRDAGDGDSDDGDDEEDPEEDSDGDKIDVRCFEYNLTLQVYKSLK